MRSSASKRRASQEEQLPHSALLNFASTELRLCARKSISSLLLKCNQVREQLPFLTGGREKIKKDCIAAGEKVLMKCQTLRSSVLLRFAFQIVIFKH